MSKFYGVYGWLSRVADHTHHKRKSLAILMSGQLHVWKAGHQLLQPGVVQEPVKGTDGAVEFVAVAGVVPAPVAGVVPAPVGIVEFVVLGAVAGVVPDVEATGVDVVAAVVAAGEAEGLAAVDVVADPVVDVVVVGIDPVVLDGTVLDGLLVDALLPVPPAVVPFVFVLLLPPIVLTGCA